LNCLFLIIILHLPHILGLVFASNLIIISFFTFCYPFVAILRTRSFYGAERQVQRWGCGGER